MLQTSSCEDIHVASVSLRAALLLPTQHSEMLNNGIHEYSPERQNRKKRQACSSKLITGSLQLYQDFIVIYSILLKHEVLRVLKSVCYHVGLKSIFKSFDSSGHLWHCYCFFDIYIAVQVTPMYPPPPALLIYTPSLHSSVSALCLSPSLHLFASVLN